MKNIKPSDLLFHWDCTEVWGDGNNEALSKTASWKTFIFQIITLVSVTGIFFFQPPCQKMIIKVFKLLYNSCWSVVIAMSLRHFITLTTTRAKVPCMPSWEDVWMAAICRVLRQWKLYEKANAIIICCEIWLGVPSLAETLLKHKQWLHGKDIFWGLQDNRYGSKWEDS